ncbi:hypothetical protein A2303_05530 [Candidatus Falkowbacteria bacterium RIFOXYB2_FULL_47_14]|uniref:UPF0758 domain-containing protein n=1 Tax=Candidatus Falkowbacteria bacterium RIFOXYA2_FULL_47_19 TaxID=1797994 RepID=A0A1F5SEB0_9BACT|nr:MAG: hypothetical protein A2227_06935 [Candidatus Falkowbacteria bacterium RIFOXYA2_FULL_47_19]OGF35310.1 MAG: hypothetical protein A2468_00085 [Candidatus Falkowbacteria bacterium RIFOXYC2_FULL_46_15]OGF43748.1 MAG: hypothetical protein A2303_05530 [Candidatus Falkowbacteria bacterium RIFOXYB2_FULL_47_14]
MSIKDLAKHEKPREKLIERGPENLRDAELMAILLGTGIEGRDVFAVARDILGKFPVPGMNSVNKIFYPNVLNF